MTYLSEPKPDDLLLNDPSYLLCSECGGDTSETKNSVCRAGYCTVLACPHCHVEIASFGPVGCPWCCPWRDPAVRALRTSYRRRRRMRRFR